MIPVGATVQLNNDYKLPLEQGSITFSAGAIGEVESPGDKWVAVRWTEWIRSIVPAKLLNHIAQEPVQDAAIVQCGNPKPEDVMGQLSHFRCSKAKGHKGRHYYTRQKPRMDYPDE